MLVAGLVRSSLIDYPGQVAAVVFTQGCNFRCGFCHNPDLISSQFPVPSSQYADKEVIEFLKTRVGKLDGVVITGGEPMVQPDLIEFIKDIKALGFLVKLDTNGSNPIMLKQVIDAKLVDYIAMDIKGPLEKYMIICGYSNTKVIQESIDIIKTSGVTYEFRTTVLPHFHELTDLRIIGKMIEGAPLYTIQGFRPQIVLDKLLERAKSFSKTELVEIRNEIAPFVSRVVIHDNLSC